MCVVSMIMDHYIDKWRPLTPTMPYRPAPVVINVEPPITDAEIREFRELLERARKYDREHNEPDCEMESKKNAIKELAKVLGIDVSFVDEHGNR